MEIVAKHAPQRHRDGTSRTTPGITPGATCMHDYTPGSIGPHSVQICRPGWQQRLHVDSASLLLLWTNAPNMCCRNVVSRKLQLRCLQMSLSERLSETCCTVMTVTTGGSHSITQLQACSAMWLEPSTLCTWVLQTQPDCCPELPHQKPEQAGSLPHPFQSRGEAHAT